MGAWRKESAVGQEKLLLDYVQRLDRFREGRRAVHLHLSRLRAYNRRDHHMRIAGTTFDALLKKFEGGLFRLQNGDMVFVAKGASIADIDEAVLRLRFLFSEDPLLNNPANEGKFCSWYDLEREYDSFRRAAEAAADAANAGPADGDSDQAFEGSEGEPLDPNHLGQVEKALVSADLSAFVRRQPVCFAPPGMPPQPLFHELYISICDLRQAVLPRYNLTSNRWLFQHLTQVLDLRMLALLMARKDVRQVKDFSLNLNISTVLSPEFLQFDRDMSAEARGTIAIEVQPVDIFADFGAFLFARDFLKDRGYKLCIDGLKHLTLPLMNRDWLGVDLLKFHWGYDLIDDLGGSRSQPLKDVVERIGRERLILSRCDSPDAAKAGAALGIAMYQGRLIDKQLQEAAAAKAPPAKVAAAS
jgi:hypothetical protein